MIAKLNAICHLCACRCLTRCILSEASSETHLELRVPYVKENSFTSAFLTSLLHSIGDGYQTEWTELDQNAKCPLL